MAAPGLDSSYRAGEEAMSDIQLLLEKAIRGIRAVDLEALCIVAGKKVRHLTLSHQTLNSRFCNDSKIVYSLTISGFSECGCPIGK